MDSAWVKYLPSILRKKIEGRAYLQNVLNNVGWLFTEKGIQIGVGLFVGVWLARYLRPKQFGTFNYALAFVALAGPFASLGLDGIVVRDLVRSSIDKEKILGTAFGLKLAGGFAAFFATFAAILMWHPQDRLMHWLVGLIGAGMVFQAFDVIRLWFESKVQAKYVVHARNASFCTVSAVRVGLILSHAPLVAFALAALLEIVLIAAGFWIAYRKKAHRIASWRWDSTVAKRLIRESWPLIISGLAVLIYMKIDLVMLGDMVGEKAVGVYSAAVRLSEVWYFIPMAIVSSVSPSIVDAKKISEDLYYQRINKLFRLMVQISLAIAVFMTAFSNGIVLVLFGPAYAAAGNVLSIHIWAAIFVFLGVARGPWILNEGFMKLSLYSTVLGAIINVCLNMYLIPGFGPIGAAVATLLSYAFAGFLFNAILRKTRTIFFMQLRALWCFPRG